MADLQAAARVLKADDVGKPGELPDDLGPVILDRQGVAVPHVDEDSHSHGRGHPVHVLVDTSSGRAAVRGGKQHESVHAGLLRIARHLEGQLIAARHPLDDRHLSLGSLHRRPPGSLVLLQVQGEKLPQVAGHHHGHVPGMPVGVVGDVAAQALNVQRPIGQEGGGQEVVDPPAGPGELLHGTSGPGSWGTPRRCRQGASRQQAHRPQELAALGFHHAWVNSEYWAAISAIPAVAPT